MPDTAASDKKERSLGRAAAFTAFNIVCGDDTPSSQSSEKQERFNTCKQKPLSNPPAMASPPANSSSKRPQAKVKHRAEGDHTDPLESSKLVVAADKMVQMLEKLVNIKAQVAGMARHHGCDSEIDRLWKGVTYHAAKIGDSLCKQDAYDVEPRHDETAQAYVAEPRQDEQ